MSPLAELARLRAGERCATSQRQLRLVGREHGHCQRVLQDGEQSVEVLGRADQHQRFGLPVGLGEHRAEPADEIVLGDHRVIDGRLHSAFPDGAVLRVIAHCDHECDELFGFDDAHRGGSVAHHLGDPPGQRVGRFGEPHRHDVVEAGIAERLEQQ
jgi:hypothetical protein